MSREKNEKQTISVEIEQFTTLVDTLQNLIKIYTKTQQNLIKVYATAQIKRELGTLQNARFLRIFDFTEQEIADVLGITQQAVNKALSKPRKGKEKATPKDSDDSVKKA